MDKNSKIVWTVVAVVVIIILGIWIWTANSVSVTPVTDTGTATTTATTTVATTTVQAAEVGLTAGQPAIAYEDALSLYANERIQFSNPGATATCQALPTAVTFRSGVSFMLDNRLDRTAVIHFTTGVVYTLPAYSFEIITLNSIHSYNVDCNASQNVVTVSIQK